MRPCLPLLALVLCPLTALAQPAAKPVDKPAPPTAPQAKPKVIATTPDKHNGTEKRHENFNKISKEGKAQLVFLGDSITEGWEGGGKEMWAKHYASRQAANFGVSGDRTEHVLWRLDNGNFDGLKPKLIVIMIGTNNAGHRKDSAADTAAGIKAILERLKAKCPDSKVLLLAIFPRGEKADDQLRTLNTETNKLIEKYADGKQVVFKDIGSKFLDDKGTLKKEIMPDFLHLTADGYKIWADAIEADIAKMMGEKNEDKKDEKKETPKTERPTEKK